MNILYNYLKQHRHVFPAVLTTSLFRESDVRVTSHVSTVEYLASRTFTACTHVLFTHVHTHTLSATKIPNNNYNYDLFHNPRQL